MSSMAENPVLIGAIASGVLWLAKKLRKNLDNSTITGLMAATALGVAVIEQVWVMRTTDVAVQAMVAEFSAFLSTLPAVVSPLLREAGAIFLSAQVVYRSLQSKLVGRAIQASAGVLQRSVSRYACFAEAIHLEESNENRG